MRWIKHMTATAQDERVASYLDDCGPSGRHEGYGFFWLLLEVVAAQIETGSDKCSATYALPTWSRLLYCHHHTVGKYLGKLEVAGLVTAKKAAGKVEVIIPNLLKYRDEYSRKSGVAPESVRSKKQIQNTEIEIDTEQPAPPGALFEMPSLPTEDEIVSETAKRLCVRHPPKRTCSPGEARKALKAIIGKLPKAQRTAKLEFIDNNHQCWCKSEDWAKDGGEYAKGLANWLAPTMGRYDMLPPPRAPTREKGFVADVTEVMQRNMLEKGTPW